MKLLNYAELQGLRLSEFLGDAAGDIYIEESGVRGIVGFGGYEEFGETRFGWRQGEEFCTAEVSLDLRSSSLLPEASARRILEKLGLPVQKGMSLSELVTVFGVPDRQTRGMAASNLRFICGDNEKFVLGCHVDDREGLVSLFLARKDYFDEGLAM